MIISRRGERIGQDPAPLSEASTWFPVDFGIARLLPSDLAYCRTFAK